MYFSNFRLNEDYIEEIEAAEAARKVEKEEVNDDCLTDAKKNDTQNDVVHTAVNFFCKSPTIGFFGKLDTSFWKLGKRNERFTLNMNLAEYVLGGENLQRYCEAGDPGVELTEDTIKIAGRTFDREPIDEEACKAHLKTMMRTMRVSINSQDDWVDWDTYTSEKIYGDKEKGIRYNVEMLENHEELKQLFWRGINALRGHAISFEFPSDYVIQKKTIELLLQTGVACGFGNYHEELNVRVSTVAQLRQLQELLPQFVDTPVREFPWEAVTTPTNVGGEKEESLSPGFLQKLCDENRIVGRPLHKFDTTPASLRIEHEEGLLQPSLAAAYPLYETTAFVAKVDLTNDNHVPSLVQTILNQRWAMLEGLTSEAFNIIFPEALAALPKEKLLATLGHFDRANTRFPFMVEMCVPHKSYKMLTHLKP